MPSKTEEYLALAQRTANGLTRYWESWTDYLTTASRLYKYPFADQLMIYAQRPDATACADYDVWNARMNRYVRRGAKGIALLDESSGFPRLHYVFDVSDTGVRRNSRDPDLWQYNDDLKRPVSEMLAATYGISGERVSQQLADVAGKLVADYWDNNGGDIRAIVDGSLLMDYDEAGVEMQGLPPRMRGKVPSRTRRRTTAGRSSGACAATSNAHNGHQPKAIGLAAPHALTQQCPELFCIGHLQNALIGHCQQGHRPGAVLGKMLPLHPGHGKSIVPQSKAVLCSALQQPLLLVLCRAMCGHGSPRCGVFGVFAAFGGVCSQPELPATARLHPLQKRVVAAGLRSRSGAKLLHHAG